MAVQLDSNVGQVFLYPQSGLVLCDDRLYGTNKYSRRGNDRVLTEYLQKMNTPRPKVWLIFTGEDRVFTTQYLLTIRFQFGTLFAPNEIYYSLNGPSKRPPNVNNFFFDGLNPAVKLIQETMRKVARKCIQDRRLAVWMAAHDRLGAASPLRLLKPDLMRLVCAGV